MTHISMTSGSNEGMELLAVQLRCQQLARREGKREELGAKKNELNAGMTGSLGLSTAACL